MRIAPATSMAGCGPRIGGQGSPHPAALDEAHPLGSFPAGFFAALALSRERLVSAQATLSLSTELIARSQEAIARSAVLLASGKRGGPSVR